MPGAAGFQERRAVAETEAYLAVLASELVAHGFRVQTGVPYGGSAATWIVEEVGMRHADMVVMATHERSGPDRWLHGSVAEAVVGQAGAPVLLIRVPSRPRAVERFVVHRTACPALLLRSIQPVRSHVEETARVDAVGPAGP